jgi:hypothetical protein
MPGKYDTRFAESEAILAAGEGDLAEVQRLARRMHPSERRALINACDFLSETLVNTHGPAEED